MKEFPEERSALLRLQEELNRLQRSGKHKELTLERIYDLTEPSSQRVLLSILGRLCQEGVISEWVRVMSPSGEAIQDYASAMDVPAVVTDWHNGMDIPVEMDSLRMIYKIEAQQA